MSSSSPAPVASPVAQQGSPLVTFFLRESALFVRARKSVWPRLIFLLFSIMAVSLNVQWGSFAPGMRRTGSLAFGGLMHVNAYLVFVLTSTSFSKVISAEREEGTLDMLRITGLSAFALLVGKGTSQFVRALLLLATQIPLCALCFVMGGLTMAEVAAAYALLVAVLFFGCHAALFWSVVSKSSRRASYATLGTVLVLYIVPWAKLISSMPSGALPPFAFGFMDWLASVSPFAAYRYVTNTGEVPWSSIIFHLVGGVIFFAAAVALFERASRQEKPGITDIPRAARGNKPRRGPLPRIGMRPLRWKEYHFAAGGRRGTRLRWLAYPACCAVAVCLMNPDGILVGYSWTQIGGAMLITGLIGLCSEIPYAATRIFGLEVVNRTLGDIAILPLRTRRIVGEKILGYVPCLLPPLACLIGGAALVFPKIRSDLLVDIEWPFAIYVALQGALLLILTVHLSFSQARSAFGIAFSVLFVANATLIGMTARLFEMAPFVGWSVFAAGTLWLLVYLILILPNHLAIAAAK
jgi:ABC-type transport system involved in cytochrome c biogenesis permease component